MAEGYERCAECGSKYESDYLQPVGGRRLCCLCCWRRAADRGRRQLKSQGAKGRWGGSLPRAR